MNPMIEFVSHTIPVQRVIDAVTSPAAGAVNIFIGTVRNHTAGREVQHLEYEAYDEMAALEIEKIFAEASAKFEIVRSAVIHRIGIVLPGEASIVLGISTAHRANAFAATSFVMDELKKRVPVWKKEIYSDGSVWVGTGS